MRRGWIYVFLACCLTMGAAVSTAQIYVSATVSAGGNGTLAAPYPLETALGKAASGDEVRLMTGTYSLEKELAIPKGVTVAGGYQTDGTQLADGAFYTVLDGKNDHRVVRLAGTLRNVTVQHGKARGGNGGGVYVESTGILENCIVKECEANYMLPKVGDLYMKDGSFLDIKDFEAKQYQEVKGVVFWVNPDKSAELGNRGCAAALDFEYSVQWNSTTIGSAAPDLKRYGNLSEAWQDYAGKSNTDQLAAIGVAIATKCRATGSEWSVPALGQWVRIASEWGLLNETFKTLWNALYPYFNSSERYEKMRSVFGGVSVAQSSSDDADPYGYESAGVWIWKDTDAQSSTVASGTDMWRFRGLYNTNSPAQNSQTGSCWFLRITEF